jgi:tellurite resistance protein TehA-like permease
LISMQPSQNHEPWQVAPVSATGRVAAASLALLAIDSIFVWSMTSVIEAAALTAIPAVVAIRVIRGFPRSPELAAATFTLALAVAIVALGTLGLVAGQARAAAVVAIALAASGLFTLAWTGLRNQLGAKPVIAMPRWPSTPVAVRSPSRYRIHRQYR